VKNGCEFGYQVTRIHAEAIEIELAEVAKKKGEVVCALAKALLAVPHG
jgi:hypothetical protein